MESFATKGRIEFQKGIFTKNKLNGKGVRADYNLED